MAAPKSFTPNPGLLTKSHGTRRRRPSLRASCQASTSQVLPGIVWAQRPHKHREPNMVYSMVCILDYIHIYIYTFIYIYIIMSVCQQKPFEKRLCKELPLQIEGRNTYLTHLLFKDLTVFVKNRKDCSLKGQVFNKKQKTQ